MAVILLATIYHGHASIPVTTGDARADSLGKSMAQLFLAKEETVPGAKHSMDIFQVQSHPLVCIGDMQTSARIPKDVCPGPFNSSVRHAELHF